MASIVNKYGFNFLWMFSYHPHHPLPEEPCIEELDFMVSEGFNFVRIPTDYRFWTTGFDYTHPDEKILAYIDRYIDAINKRGLHCCLNLHRAPGYCINSPQTERHNLWRDAEAQEGFIFLWKMFAERYKDIDSDKLSFDLINEPCDRSPTHPCTRADHEKVIRRTITAIREIDPSREIVIDGFDGGGSALPELADAGVIHSGRGYEPFQVTHYKAEWVGHSGEWIMPEYPGEVSPGNIKNIDTLRRYYKPWIDLEKQGVKVHIGEFGCYNKLPNDLALRWFNDILTVFRENNWGYSLWNFRGAFGVADHGRPGTVYEDYRGMKIDRALLDLLKTNMRFD